MRTQLLRFSVSLATLLPGASLAASPPPPPASANTAQCQGLTNVAGPTECSSSSGTPTLIGKVGNIIDTLLIVAGAVAVIIIILSGIRYITSTGDAARIKAAKDSLLYAVIGLVVVIIARFIVGFTIGQVG